MEDEKRKFSKLHLNSEEKLLWYGQPESSLQLYVMEYIRGYYGRARPIVNLMIMVIAIIGFIADMKPDSPTLFVIVGYPIMLAIILFNGWQNSQQTSNRLRYMITDKRLLIFDTETTGHQGYHLSGFQEISIIPVQANYKILQFDNKLRLLTIQNAETVKKMIEPYLGKSV